MENLLWVVFKNPLDVCNFVNEHQLGRCVKSVTYEDKLGYVLFYLNS